MGRDRERRLERARGRGREEDPRADRALQPAQVPPPGVRAARGEREDREDSRRVPVLSTS